MKVVETNVVLVVERRGLSLAVGQVAKDGPHEFDGDGVEPVRVGAPRIAQALNLRDGQYRISVERIGD